MSKLLKTANGFHLHRAKNGGFFVNCYQRGRQTWRTSETYNRRHGAINALFSGFDSYCKAAGLQATKEATIAFIDHTDRTPVHALTTRP